MRNSRTHGSFTALCVLTQWWRKSDIESSQCPMCQYNVLAVLLARWQLICNDYAFCMYECVIPLCMLRVKAVLYMGCAAGKSWKMRLLRSKNGNRCMRPCTLSVRRRYCQSSSWSTWTWLKVHAVLVNIYTASSHVGSDISWSCSIVSWIKPHFHAVMINHITHEFVCL